MYQIIQIDKDSKTIINIGSIGDLQKLWNTNSKHMQFLKFYY